MSLSSAAQNRSKRASCSAVGCRAPGALVKEKPLEENKNGRQESVGSSVLVGICLLGTGGSQATGRIPRRITATVCQFFPYRRRGEQDCGRSLLSPRWSSERESEQCASKPAPIERLGKTRAGSFNTTRLREGPSGLLGHHLSAFRFWRERQAQARGGELERLNQ